MHQEYVFDRLSLLTSFVYFYCGLGYVKAIPAKSGASDKDSNSLM